jgi:hypothetical protein
MARTFFSFLAILVIVVTSYSVANTASLNLQLRSWGSYFTIQNIGHDPVSILDIVVNDRSDCSAYTLPPDLPNEKGIQTTLDYYEKQLKALDAPPDPRYMSPYYAGTIDTDRRTYHGLMDGLQRQLALVLKLKNTDLHKLWVFGGLNGNDIPDKPITLKVGDTHTWQTDPCNIVRVIVSTEQGSETYSFAN